MGMEIGDRILGREHAEEWLAALREERECKSDEFNFGFMRALHEASLGYLKMIGKAPESEIEELPGVHLEPMDTQHALWFERKICPYASYRGANWGSVPMAYINMIADGAKEIIRYCQSDRAKKRTESQQHVFERPDVE